MQNIKFFILLSALVSAAECFAGRWDRPVHGGYPGVVPESCLWDFSAISTPPLLRAFHGDPGQLNEFKSIYRTTEKHEAIRLWVLSLERAQAFSPEEIKVQSLGFAGGAINSGIYTVQVRGVTQWVVKVSDCLEVDQLWRLKKSALSRLECIQKRDASVKQSSDFPKFAQILDSALLPINSSCIQLFEFASGRLLKDYGPGPELPAVYQKVGEQVGRLHSLGFAHGDLHQGNVFYDQATGQLTLIDSGLIQEGKGASSDLLKLIMRNLKWSVQEISQYLHFELQVLLKQRETQTQADLDHAFVQWLSHEVVHSSASHATLSEQLAHLHQHAENLKSFMRGYMSVMQRRDLLEKVPPFIQAQCHALLLQVFDSTPHLMSETNYERLRLLMPSLFECVSDPASKD